MGFTEGCDGVGDGFIVRTTSISITIGVTLLMSPVVKSRESKPKPGFGDVEDVSLHGGRGVK